MYREEQLSAFVQVVECGSFSQAARKLNRSQAAISQAVKNLERSLGFSVFDRQGTRVRLNSRGEQMYQLCQSRQKALNRLEQLADHARQETESDITLHLASTLDQRALAPSLVQFHHQFPFTRLRIGSAWQQASLVIVAAEAIAEETGTEAAAAFDWQPYTEITLVPVCGMLATAPKYIQVPWGPNNRASQRQLSTSTPDTAWQMVRDNIGWTWIPEHLLSDYRCGVEYQPYANAEPCKQRYLAGIRRTHGPASRWLLDRLLTPTHCETPHAQ